jgi:hypothetical protein
MLFQNLPKLDKDSTKKEHSRPTSIINISVKILIKTLANQARRQWLTPIILATQKAEIRRITVQSQPEQIVRCWKPTGILNKAACLSLAQSQTTEGSKYSYAQ